MPRRTGWSILVPVVCLVTGLLLGATRAHTQAEPIPSRTVELSSVIRNAELRVAQAEKRAAALQEMINAAAGSDLSPLVAEEVERGRQWESTVGLTEVSGPGLSVVLSDAPRDADGNYPAGVNPDDLVVHQQDVQSVVNALWAGGAEAMMIMDQRVTAQSAVRCIGNTLLLMGRAYSPPFRITAIGDGNAMVDALNAEPGVQLFVRYVKNFGLGFSVEMQENVTMPAYDGLVRMNSAQEVQR